MSRAIVAMAIGLAVAGAGVAHGDELVLPAGSSCTVAKPGKPAEVDRRIDIDVSHFLLERQSAEACAVCSRDLETERGERRRTVEAALQIAAPEPGWRIAVRWAAIGGALVLSAVAGAVLL